MATKEATNRWRKRPTLYIIVAVVIAAVITGQLVTVNVLTCLLDDSANGQRVRGRTAGLVRKTSKTPAISAIQVAMEAALAGTELVAGSAAPHRHDLVLGHHSVHTSPESLESGERRIREIRQQLERAGRL